MFSFFRGLLKSDFELCYETCQARISEVGFEKAEKEYEAISGSDSFRNGYLCALILVKSY